MNYDLDTIIKNEKISKEEQLGLQKTFVLYVLAPKWMYPIIKLCESNDPSINKIYRVMVNHFSEINFKNDSRFEEVKDTRKLSVLENPPLEVF